MKAKAKAAVFVALRSEPVELGSTVSDADGNFSMSVTIPADTPPGAHTIWVYTTGADGQPLALYQPIQVLAATNGSGELAFTGSTNQTPWLALGAVTAILVGMALIGRTRQPEPVLVEMRSLRPIDPIDPIHRNRRPHQP